MDEIDELRSLLIEWRNAPDKDIWFLEGIIDEKTGEEYFTPQGEQEILIAVIKALVETKFESINPKITTYVLPEWEEDRMNLKEVRGLSGDNGKAIQNRVERGKEDEIFIVAGAGDGDSRPPYVVYLARGGMKWSDGWFVLGATNQKWESVRTDGLFGNDGGDGELSVSDERMEYMENDDEFWGENGSLGWALKIKFVGVLGYNECLNWNEWPEALLGE